MVPGEWVNVKIIAVNAYGESVFSDVGSGGKIQAIPDPPINLIDIPEITAAGIIAFQWDEGASNGGTPVLDYRITYAEGRLITWSVLDTLYASNSKTTTGLIGGLTYKFRVQSRNLEGLSDYSETIVIRAAKLPEAPTFVTTHVN